MNANCVNRCEISKSQCRMVLPKRRPLGSVVEHSLHTRGVSSSNLLAGTIISMKRATMSRPFSFAVLCVAMELLFSYGTLRLEDVQRETFGRTLNAAPDELVGYRVVSVQIHDPDFIAKNGAGLQNNLQYTSSASDAVEGVTLELTTEELELADSYEPAEYKRKLVQLRSGLTAWVYLTNSE